MSSLTRELLQFFHPGLREQLMTARARRAHQEMQLAESEAFAKYRAAPAAAAAIALETDLRKIPAFIEWLSTSAAIRELETLAKSTGAGS